MNNEPVKYNESHFKYIDMLEWHAGRTQEIINKIKSKNCEIIEQDLEFLAAISRAYYKRQRNK